MPNISTFYGITIQMFWGDHEPPHFHALYGEHEVIMDIQTLAILRGSIPQRALRLVIDWALQHQQELMENWRLCDIKKTPVKISPLE